MEIGLVIIIAMLGIVYHQMMRLQSGLPRRRDSEIEEEARLASSNYRAQISNLESQKADLPDPSDHCAVERWMKNSSDEIVRLYVSQDCSIDFTPVDSIPISNVYFCSALVELRIYDIDHSIVNANIFIYEILLESARRRSDARLIDVVDMQRKLEELRSKRSRSAKLCSEAKAEMELRRRHAFLPLI